MKFEVGKTYIHNGGQIMKIIGIVQSYMYGLTLVGEVRGEPNFRPVGKDEEATVNWTEL